MERCSDFMTQNPICCMSGESVERAAQLMLAEDVGSIPIVDDSHNRKLIGILTDRDIAHEDCRRISRCRADYCARSDDQNADLVLIG